MALTRKALKAMGLTDEQVDSIIEMHTETTDGLKADLNKYKGDAEKLPAVQKELNELKAAGDGGYKEKYEKEHKDFEDFKKAQKGKDEREAREKVYREILKEAGVSEKRIDSIIKVADINALELEDGKAKEKDKLIESVKTEWSDFIVADGATGAKTSTPPGNGGKTSMTREDISKISDRSERRAAMIANKHLYEKGDN